MNFQHGPVAADGVRRRQPRIWNTDWLMLKAMRKAIDAELDQVARSGHVAIDFGCGEQPYRPLVEDRGANYLGADLGSEAAITIADDGHVLAPDASGDLVLSFQVLEHVRDLDRYFDEAARLLRPGGRLLLSTHGTWLYHPHPEDHRRWTRDGLYNELESRGWHVDRCHSLVGPLAWTTMIRLTGFCFVLRKIPVVGRFAAGLLSIAMNLRGLVEDLSTPESIRAVNGCVYLISARRATA